MTCPSDLHGVGNIKGNRSNVDQLIRKENENYKVVETKLRIGTSRLSKGQKAIKEHIELGNKEFEVRFKIKKGDIIHISEYEVKYKFK